MDLNTVTEIARPRHRAELPAWREGDAWLGGGTWLFSEPQSHVTRLIDITDLAWPALEVTDRSLRIAATCKVAELDGTAFPASWTAAPLFNQCCRAFLASFKVWNMATVGGNLCMALPAGPMISLTAALEGACTIWNSRRRRAPRFSCRFHREAGTQRACSRRTAPPHRFADRCIAAANSVQTNLAEPAWPLRGTADRHARAG